MDSKWMAISNFLLFAVLFSALIFTILHSFHETASWNDFREESADATYAKWQPLVPRPRIVDPDASGHNHRDARPTATAVSTEQQHIMRLYAQFAALASYCTSEPSPGPCLRNWTHCVNALALSPKIDLIDSQHVLGAPPVRPVMGPALTLGAEVLAKFSTYQGHTWTGSEGIIAHYPHQQAIVIGFGGSTVWSDWVNDFRAWMAPYDAWKGVPDPAGQRRVMVHQGMWGIYKTLRITVLTLISDILKRYPNHRLVLVGHSMGGALATFCLMDIRSLQIHRAFPSITPPPLPLVPREDLPVVKKDLNISLFSYGKPRIGNRDFVEYFEQLVTPSWLPESDNHALSTVEINRIVFRHDIVPTLPPVALGYHHTSLGHYWVANGGESGDGDIYACPVIASPLARNGSETASSTMCKFDGFRQIGHVSYFWNFDRIRSACRVLDTQMFFQRRNQHGVFVQDYSSRNK